MSGCSGIKDRLSTRAARFVPIDSFGLGIAYNTGLQTSRINLRAMSVTRRMERSLFSCDGRFGPLYRDKV